ncbi:uncharacterized protein BHQ10_000160 [Talaromyces amestolkiae]|uniref:O-methyltransferase C-terminal domain-containing protein n=1 Tax=Talaromyces amestolkiae TaxID=1196081 RepID=A0A364KKR8_TALAM|nr:uncharacterized protein BHQ10_000160 [Talaromyces amestolkiae]RAO64148.1 hypothetical protein BHQ10_000160 [Talaromyces amestolkiae]
MTSTSEDPISIIAKLHSLAASLNDGNNHEARKKCLQLSKNLTSQLEQPENVAVDMAFSPMIAVTARIAVDLNLFQHVVNEGPVASARLAELCGAEEILIIRLMRPLSAIRFVEETGPRTWKATPITAAMATEEIAAGHRMISQLIVPAVQKAPEFLLRHGYSCPIDPREGLVQHAFQTNDTTFERITSSPSLLKDFNTFMGNTMGARNYWVDWYPVQARILGGADPEKPLIVDVGAGKGHDLLAFHSKFPGAGKLVLQDLQPVIETLDNLDPVIEKVAYDFFTQQPVQDNYCREILQRVVSAMMPGYSKLLLHEIIVLEEGAPQFQAQLDMTMMAFNSGMERTAKQWRELLESVGLRVVKIWESVEEGADGIVEAMKD